MVSMTPKSEPTFDDDAWDATAWATAWALNFFVPVQNDVVNALSFINVRFKCSLLTF